MLYVNNHENSQMSFKQSSFKNPVTVASKTSYQGWNQSKSKICNLSNQMKSN